MPPTSTSSTTSPATTRGSAWVRGQAWVAGAWHTFTDGYDADGSFIGHPGTAPEDRLLHYFTSGTTSRPKLVEHTQVSYPVGHLTTMYWLGLRPGDVHLAISSPGWAKHAWSCFFAPWIAEATIFVFNYARFDPQTMLEAAAGPGGDVVLRAAHRVADAHQVRPDRRVRLAARADRRRRAAEPRGDRPGAAALGHDDPRRVRPDRDDGGDRELAGVADQGRLDGTPAARLPDRPRRSRHRVRGWTAMFRARSASTSRHRSAYRFRS